MTPSPVGLGVKSSEFRVLSSEVSEQGSWFRKAGPKTMETVRFSLPKETRTGVESEASPRYVVGRSRRSRPGALTGGATP